MISILFQTNQATEKSQKKTSKDAENDYEASELLLYQAKILSEGNQKEEALTFLKENESDILDKVARLEALSQVRFLFLVARSALHAIFIVNSQVLRHN